MIFMVLGAPYFNNSNLIIDWNHFPVLIFTWTCVISSFHPEMSLQLALVETKYNKHKKALKLKNTTSIIKTFDAVNKIEQNEK